MHQMYRSFTVLLQKAFLFLSDTVRDYAIGVTMQYVIANLVEPIQLRFYAGSLEKLGSLPLKTMNTA
jgi:hypothetical protein